MSDKIVEQQPGIEIPGQTHIVSRRKISRIEFHGENVGFGQPTSEKDFIELQNIAAKEAEDFIRNQTYTKNVISEPVLRDIATHVNNRFMFHNSHDVGIGTIPKQIENYRTGQNQMLPDKLDCKLVPVMTGLTPQEVGKRWGIDTKLFLTSRGSNMTPHPSVIIEVSSNPASENTLFIDFHTNLETDEINFTVRTLDERTQLAHKESYKAPLDVNSLKELDEVFLRA